MTLFPRNARRIFQFAAFIQLLLVCVCVAQAAESRTESVNHTKSACLPCVKFNQLNTEIRDGKIDKKVARAKVKELLAEVKSWYMTNCKHPNNGGWVFPVENYTPRAIGGTNGSCYVAGGYNYYDGNKHTGHPSFDIFIRDRNQDSLDDATLKPVNVLSMTGGIVVSDEPAWNERSALRGGKYIWIYDPYSDALVYYAHNRELFVSVGDMVRPGDRIAAVGRTGLNAYKKRSPTHLHLTYLENKGGSLLPRNIYRDLLKSRIAGKRQ